MNKVLLGASLAVTLLVSACSQAPAEVPGGLGAQFGSPRDDYADVVATDAEGYERLRLVLGEQFDVTGASESRTVSVPAPGEVSDLGRVVAVVDATGIAVDEVSLRRPSLDDAFLALTGRPASGDEDVPDTDHVDQEVAA